MNTQENRNPNRIHSKGKYPDKRKKNWKPGKKPYNSKKPEYNHPKTQPEKRNIDEPIVPVQIPIDSFQAAISLLKGKGAVIVEATPAMAIDTNIATGARIRFYIDKRYQISKCPNLWHPLSKSDNIAISEGDSLTTPEGNPAKMIGFALKFEFNPEHPKTKEDIEKIIKLRNDYFYKWALAVK